MSSKKQGGDEQSQGKKDVSKRVGGGTAHSIFRMPLTTRKYVPQHTQIEGSFTQEIDGQKRTVFSIGGRSIFDLQNYTDDRPFRMRR